MANENLIAYQEQLKQKNLNDIASFQQTLDSLDQLILQMNQNIDSYNIQKTEYQQKITDTEAGNVLIDQTIAILSQ